MSYTIGLDLGTTTCKALAIDERGQTLAAVGRPVAMSTGADGAAEQDAIAVADTVMVVLRELVAALPDGGPGARALACSGAMHSVVPIGTDDRPMSLAMTWADTRAAGAVAPIRRTIDAVAMYRRTGCPVRSTYHPARLRWLMGDGRRGAGTVMKWVAIKDVLMHRLIGRWLTDESLASTTGLYDITARRWDDEALSAAGITTAQLPEVAPSAAIVGTLRDAAAQMTGLPRGLAIAAGAADGPLAMLGSGGAQARGVVMTIGTSGAVRLLVNRPLLDPRERTWCYVLTEGLWVAGGAINNAGLAIEWVRRLAFGMNEDGTSVDDESAKPQAVGAAGGLVDREAVSHRETSFAALLREAGAVPVGADGLIFVPYLSGERSPHWDPMLRGALHGLSLRHTRGHLARAAMESVAFCLAEVYEALCVRASPRPGVQNPESGVESRGAVRLTGGVTQAPVWCQIVADVLGETIETLDGGDASALGAAIMARAAIENCDVLTLARSIEHHVTRYEPHHENHARYGVVMERFRAMAAKSRPAP